MIKNNKGITLVALVITIIVLLILAGVSIATLVGDNGIINRTATAKQTTEEKAELEKVKLAVQAARIHGDSYSDLTVKDVKDALEYDHITVTGDAFPLTATSGLYQFTIDANGNVSKKDTTTPSNPATVSVTGVSIEVTGGTVNQDESITIAPGETLTLEATVTPGDATDKSLTWSVSPNDESVISLSSTTSATITVTGVAVGAEARTVTVTTTDGNFTASKTIKVESATPPSTVSSVTIKGSTDQDITVTKENVGTYYGEVVTNYTKNTIDTDNDKVADTSMTYRLFYIDFDGLFGPAGTIYLKADYDDRVTKALSTTVSSNSEDIALFKTMNPKWAEVRGESSWENNEKAASWLCAKSQWTDYVDNKKADFAIGSPSLEMYLKSYTQVSHTTNSYALECDYADTTTTPAGNTPGYIYLINGAQSTVSNNYYNTGINTLDNSGYSQMYCKPNQYWWLASPSADGANSVCLVRGDYAFLNYGIYSNRIGVSPLVSLKSNFKPQVNK